MGPLRAIRRDALLDPGMRELTYGWTSKLRCGRRALDGTSSKWRWHRRRAGGVSKVCGTATSKIWVCWRILLTFARIVLETGRPPPLPPAAAAARR
jgi:hypothetical protein